MTQLNPLFCRVLCVPQLHVQESQMGQTVVPVQTNGALVVVNNGTVDHKTSKTCHDDDKTRKQVSAPPYKTSFVCVDA